MTGKAGGSSGLLAAIGPASWDEHLVYSCPVALPCLKRFGQVVLHGTLP